MRGSREGNVRGLAKDGDAVIETEEGLVFASGGVPGDRVRLDGLGRDGKRMRAKRLRVIEPSPERVEVPCPVLEQCGGCPWMPASIAVQHREKLALVARALGAVPGFEPGALTMDAAESLGYRRRARLAWRRTGQKLILGFRARGSHRIADVARCVVLEESLNRGLDTARALPLAGEGELHLTVGQGERPVIALESDAPQPPQLYESLQSCVDTRQLAGVSLRCGGASIATLMGKAAEISTDIEGRLMVGSPTGFSQAQRTINEHLGAAVLDWATPAGHRVLELYAGHGNLTLALAARAELVRAVEWVGPATRALRENLRVHDLRAEVVEGDVAASIPRKGFDIVVLDPPRTGAKAAMASIQALAPRTIVYVSCDPATLGRDLRELTDYRITQVRAFDMFPHTAHVETVVQLVRA